MDKEQSNDAGVFDLSLSDSDLLTEIKKPISDSEAYWNGTFGLKKAREDNMNLWLPNHWKGTQVYDYQEDYLYQDPRVFISVETICSVTNSRIAQPEISPAQEGIISYQLSQDLQKSIFAHSEKYYTNDIFRIATRNLLLKRVGYAKLRFDPSVGDHGEIVPEHVAPEDVVVDQDAKWNECPRFLAQKIRNKTGEELIAMFPESKQKVYQMLGVNRRNGKGDLVAYKAQLAKKKDIWEVWFRFYNEENKTYDGGLAFVDENCQYVLGKMKNPNWNYDDDPLGDSNILDYPMPPFFSLNYLNDGTSAIDLTSMVEQAAPLQRILDRRGFQIMESAEQAGSGLIFNTNMITKEEMQKLEGSPDERIGVKGNVNEAVTRIPYPQMPNYVIEDKQDARSEIDNIFATHDISRGEQSNNKTLGQDNLQQSQDYTRMDDIARAVERMATQYYRYLVQMFKVYYTEDHWFKATGEDGQFDFVLMRNDLIEDGVDVQVEAGSTLPVNKISQQKNALELAQLGMIDPLSLYKVMAGQPLPSPKKMLEGFMLFKTDPIGYMGKVEDEDFDRKAFMDIQVLNSGDMPLPRDDISPEYLNFMNQYMAGPEFMGKTDVVKALFVEWNRICQTQAQQQLVMQQQIAPTPEEMNAQNEESLQSASTAQQIQGANQEPVPGKAVAPPPEKANPFQK